MYFIAVASLPLTLFGYLTRRVTMIDSTGWMGSIADGLSFAVVMALISAPLLIALLGTMLATTHRSRFIIVLLATLALLTVAAVRFTIPTMQLIQILVGYCGSAAVSFWVMNCCGYRLTRNRPAQVPVATTLDNVSPRYRSTLLPLSVLGLLFVVLLIPAWHFVKYCRARALEFEWRRRGVAVSVEDGQVTVAVILTKFGNRSFNGIMNSGHTRVGRLDRDLDGNYDQLELVDFNALSHPCS